ncbi:hypothetical protein PybrP1_013162 [[Pythium] brassicae (nom. inval.)]|nr:hypothetical protein PybrP1_013162 [[Pythium] brassicae (nom. inval.)]
MRRLLSLRTRMQRTRHQRFFSSNRNPPLETQVDTETLASSRLLPSEWLQQPALNANWQVVKREHYESVPIPPGWEQELEALQTRLGVKFRNKTLLMTALTHHGAFVHPHVPADVPAQRLSNRSLEFLGDSLLSAATAAFLFQTHPLHQEGQLTHSKWALVSNETLSKICVHDLELHRLVLVASDYSLARQSSKVVYVKGRATIQAGAVESLIAAVYLDQGINAALDFINTKVLPAAIKHATQEPPWEPITELQNLLQANGLGHPIYKHLPAPLKSVVFKATLIVKGAPILTESGPSYKEARLKAAEAGYQHYAPLFGAREPPAPKAPAVE